MRVAQLILDIPVRTLDSLYSYRVPERLKSLQVGMAVRVSFGKRAALGFIAELLDVDDCEQELGLSPESMKQVEETLGGPYFGQNAARCARFISERYLAPLSTCIRLFAAPGSLPRLVRREGSYELVEPKVKKVTDTYVRITDAGRAFSPRHNAVKQKLVLGALATGDAKVSELAREYGEVRGAIAALEEKGAVELIKIRRGRTSDDHVPRRASAYEYQAQALRDADLTRGQQCAFQTIGQLLDTATHGVVVIDGVTGSGKTEVYLRAIQRVLDAGQNALVLVPEIALTPQTLARFRGRFGHRVASLHSKMGAGERFDEWDYIRSGEARVVVGARSALFAPIDKLGIIVIDEEHEGSYKQDSSPRYHARDVALWMAQQRGIPLVLGSATPSIETLYACSTEPTWQLVRMPERANARPLPEVRVIDMAHEFRAGSRSMFSHELARALEAALKAGHKAILLLNQRGFAQFLLCRDCGYVPRCENCSTSFTYHEHEHALVCHHCHAQMRVPAVCPNCSSPYLKKFGAGTQRVEAELIKLLGQIGLEDVPVIRMDADTTRNKGSHQELLERFREAGASVLLGTQMIAKGLDIADVVLVGVINADTQLNLPDFRSSERSYQLVEQVSGRAGRADLEGIVYVQSYQAHHPAILAAARHERRVFLDDELPKRAALGYPPYSRMVNLLFWSKDQRRLASEAQRVHAELVQALPFEERGISMLPASPCALERLRGTYRWHILLRSAANVDIADAIAPYVKKIHLPNDVLFAIDVDPISLF